MLAINCATPALSPFVPRQLARAAWCGLPRACVALRSRQIRTSAADRALGNSPLFAEWLDLAGVGFDELVSASPQVGFGPDDALVVIDMQRDFVPRSAFNPDGGRFGVAAVSYTHLTLPTICSV